MARRRPEPRPAATEADQILGEQDSSLLDIIDNVLNKGVVLSGDLTIGLAQVDLVYARLSVLLCAADRVLPGGTGAGERPTTAKDTRPRGAARRHVRRPRP